VDPWNPGANSALGVFAFSSMGTSLQVGGELTSIGNFAHQQVYAEFSPNNAPVASFTSSCSRLTCTFGARGSHDAEGPISDLTWDLGDGGTAAGATTSHTYTANGSPVVTLSVTDDDGMQVSTTRSLVVSSSPPVARFTLSCPDS
jgi:PKD repeat protein